MFQRWTSTELHGVTNQKIILITVTAERNTNATYVYKNYIWIEKIMYLHKFEHFNELYTHTCWHTQSSFCFMLHRKKHVCDYKSLPWIPSSNFFVIQWPTPYHYLYCFIFMCSSWLKKKENYVHININH